VRVTTDGPSSESSVGQVIVAYDGKVDDRVRLAAEVDGWVERDGVALAGLGWSQRQLDHLDDADRAARIAAEQRRRDHGLDHVDRFRRAWEVPPASPTAVAADVEAAVRVFDRRDPALIRYEVVLEGPLLVAPAAAVVGWALFGF
jgi:hypothetical protein